MKLNLKLFYKKKRRNGKTIKWEKKEGERMRLGNKE